MYPQSIAKIQFVWVYFETEESAYFSETNPIEISEISTSWKEHGKSTNRVVIEM